MVSHSGLDESRALRFTGGRFDNSDLSLEAWQAAVATVAEYERIIYRIARHRYRTMDDSARQVPHGFEDHMKFVVDFFDGSLVASYKPRRRIPTPATPIVSERTAFEDSVSLCDRALVDFFAGNSAATLQELPDDVRESFKKFGHRLQSAEKIQISSGSEIVVALDHASRNRLQDLSLEDHTVRMILTGQVFRMEADTHHVVLGASNYQPSKQLRCAYEHDTDFEILKSSITSQIGRGPKIAGEGVLVVTATRFVKEAHLSRTRKLTPSEDNEMDKLLSRIDHLAELEDGWHDGSGSAPMPHLLDTLRELSGVFYYSGLPYPRVYPIDDGGISLEWTLGPKRASVTFEPHESGATVCIYDKSAPDPFDSYRYGESVDVNCASLAAWLQELGTVDA